MNGFSIPNSWILTNLGTIVEYGKTQKCELPDVSPETWVLELEDIEKDSSRIIQRFNANTRPFKSTKNKFKKGDVLYGKLRPYLNKVIVADGSGACSTEIVPIDAEPNVKNHFLFYWLKSETFLDYVNTVSYGVNMPRLGTQDGMAAPFILPPLAEQKVIADKLDTLLAQVETTKAHLECTLSKIKRFRQCILASAVSGKLTDNRCNKWVLKKLIDLTMKIGSGATPKGGRNAYKEFGIPLIRSLNIHTNFIKYKDLAFIDEEQASKLTNVEVEENDVLLNITGASIGRVNIAPKDLVGGRVNQHVAIIRCIQEKLIPKYLHMYLASPCIQEWIEKENYGATRQALTKLMLEDLQIALPPPKEQIEIIQRVEELFLCANSIEQKTCATLESLKKTTQTILAKAFRGELTANWRVANPDLISGRNSAEALLKKIKIEREALKKQPKPNRTAVKKQVGNSMGKQIKVLEVLKQAGKPLNGQQLLAASGYPNDSSTEELEKFFLDIREALIRDKSIMKLERSDDGQDWFSLAEMPAQSEGPL